jgi:hypothetical protein
MLIGDPAERPEDFAMEFRLTYEGRVASGNSATPQHKHAIRRVFHKQLKAFWNSHPFLPQEQAWGGKFAASLPKNTPSPPNRIAESAAYYARGHYHFVPLVFDEQRLLCHLDILFLRPGLPGAALQGGDLDNRMKTLFDALKVPEGINGQPEDGEDPFFVLLEDDQLVTRVSVETDQLLQPTAPDAGQQDARLVITVRLTPYVRLIGTMGF